MANDGSNQAQYLPTYNGGNVNALGPGYDIRGLNDPGRAVAAAGQRTAQGGAEFGHSVQQLAQTYNSVLNIRHGRDEEERANAMFREMRLADSQLEGANADNLYFIRRDGMAELKDQFVKDSPLRSDAAGDIFNKYSGQHLNWSMNHMLRQAKVAEKMSKKKAASSLVRKASEAPLSIGTVKSLQQESEALYRDEPQLAETLTGLATQGLINAQAARNPSAAAKWAADNKDKLAETMGPDAANKFVTGMEKAARKNEQRIAANEAQYRKLNQAKKNQVTRELKSLAASWVTSNKPFDDQEFMNFANGRGIDAVGIREAQDYYYKLIENDTKRDSNVVAAGLLFKEDDITDMEYGAALNACGKGEITLATCNKIESKYKMQSEASKGDRSAQTKIVNKAILQAAGGSMMSGPMAAIMGSNTSDTPISLQAQQVWLNTTKDMNQEQLLRASNLQDPNSVASIIVQQVLTQTDAQAVNLNMPLSVDPNEDPHGAEMRQLADESVDFADFVSKRDKKAKQGAE